LLTTALDHVINELRERPATRQAVLPIFDANQDMPHMGGAARVPCSLHYQFLVRYKELDMIYVMRSSDFLTHFPYDIWMALELQSYVAAQLRIPVHHFTFFTGSLHLYAKDADPGVF
jgi:thymidylate synthase